jgi:hypothetical protein
MKSLSTILVAIVLFGLCLIEKELKKRAVDSKIAGENLVSNKTTTPDRSGDLHAPKRVLNTEKHVLTTNKLSGLSVTDSTFNGLSASFYSAF